MGKSKRFEINRKWEQEFIILDTIHGIQDLINLDFRTPGGRLAVQYVAKRAKGPQNAMVTSAKRLGGLNRMRSQNYRRIHKHYRRVSRAYGGVFDHSEVKNRIIRTFFTEEVKNVKKTMALQASLEAKKNKKAKKGAKGGKKRTAKN